MRFSEHPLRRQIVGEMHLRRFPALELPAMAFQTVRLVDENDREKEWLILQQRCASGLDRNLRHLETEWSANGRLAWERHSEAVTTTLTSTSVSADAQFWSAPDVGPFSDTLQWMETLPGLVIRATHIVVVANDSYAEQVVDRADFHPGHLVSCIIGDSVRIWSDFRIHAGGYGRLVVAANGAADGEVSRSIQRIQELGNYRNLSLLEGTHRSIA